MEQSRHIWQCFLSKDVLYIIGHIVLGNIHYGFPIEQRKYITKMCPEKQIYCTTEYLLTEQLFVENTPTIWLVADAFYLYFIILKIGKLQLLVCSTLLYIYTESIYWKHYAHQQWYFWAAFQWCIEKWNRNVRKAVKNTEHLEISESLSIHCKTLSQISVLYCV